MSIASAPTLLTKAESAAPIEQKSATCTAIDGRSLDEPGERADDARRFERTTEYEHGCDGDHGRMAEAQEGLAGRHQTCSHGEHEDREGDDVVTPPPPREKNKG